MTTEAACCGLYRPVEVCWCPKPQHLITWPYWPHVISSIKMRSYWRNRAPSARMTGVLLGRGEAAQKRHMWGKPCNSGGRNWIAGCASQERGRISRKPPEARKRQAFSPTGFGGSMTLSALWFRLQISITGRQKAPVVLSTHFAALHKDSPRKLIPQAPIRMTENVHIWVSLWISTQNSRGELSTEMDILIRK